MRQRLAPAAALTIGVLVWVTMQAQQRRPDAPTLTASDYIEIQQLVAHYSYALDTGADNGYMYADLFAPDGVMHSRINGQAAKSDFKGREQLATLARINAGATGTRGPLYVSHFLTNHVIYPAPGGATGKQYLAILDLSQDGKPGAVRHGGHYEDVYVKTDKGWRFKRREMIRVQSGPSAVPTAGPR
jgi:hypothetical protein